MKIVLLIINIYWLYITSTVASAAFYGLNYGINRDACPNLDKLDSDFKALSQYASHVRIYSVKDCDLGENALLAAQANGVKLYMGMWIDKTDSFLQELVSLKKLVSDYNVQNIEAIIVGSEVIYRGDVSSDQLTEYINQVKEVVHPLGIQVTTSDVYYKFEPNVVSAVDFIMMNAFPYWEGTNISEAPNTLFEHYMHVKSLSNGKVVRISETGWPEEGAVFGDSIPRSDYQKEKLRNNLKRDEVIVAELSLLHFKSSTVNKDRFVEHLQERVKVTSVMKAYYLTEDHSVEEEQCAGGFLSFRKMKLSSFINQQQADKRLAKKLREKFGKDTILILSNWLAGNVKHHEPMRDVGMRRMLAKDGLQVYLFDEFQTSSLCPSCRNGELETFKKVQNPRPYQREKHLIADHHGLLS
ncbi:hypothetical protein G6F46_000776 [Rhizopus delemar]|nr:hypothetical protein G6F55_002350 [Rhizopus delemar]KAG1549986.1 hypothetical protein G6F51_002724 [Rhizopus arrhizus]KAG1526615.1 hypothetical protein G6F52_002269 [Rhizopus delemar]KAG1560963.1 hypothetical protein G6F49_002227 [Rhizopus delemar]KAG1575251.1 hypothetical protein G6F50_001251 [Rhizopus delemar]